MATSAFKSTTARTPIGAPPTTDVSGSSASSTTKAAHRRSRSLSRFSRRVLEPESDYGETPAPPSSKGKFVNKVRGSGFGEISLDDLAIEFFSVKDERGDERESERGRSSSRRYAGVSSRVAAPTESSERRGRSVSRQRSGGGDEKSKGNLCGGTGGGGRIGSDAGSRRRRSVSAVRCQISDSEVVHLVLLLKIRDSKERN